MADETLDSIYLRNIRNSSSFQALDTILSRNGLDRNFQPVTPETEGAPVADQAHKAGTQSRIDKIRAGQKADEKTAPSFMGDVVGGTIKEIPRAIIGGATAGAKELLESAQSLADFFNEKLGTKKGGAFGAAAEAIPEVVGQNETPGGKLLRGISQVATGYVAGGKLLGGAAKAAGAGKVTSAMVKGAFSDAAAFDPNDPTLSNWINESFPGLANPLTKFLATDPGDNEALNRFKRAAEGIGVGVAMDAVIGAARNLRARMAMKKVEAAFTEAKAAPAGVTEPSPAVAAARPSAASQVDVVNPGAVDTTRGVPLGATGREGVMVPERLMLPAPGQAVLTADEIAENAARELKAQRMLQPNPTLQAAQEAVTITSQIRGNPTLRAAQETLLRGQSDEAIAARIVQSDRAGIEAIIKSEGGEISPALVGALARATAGGAIGLTQGDTMEERIAFAVAGAGIGLALKPANIKKLIGIFEKAAPREAQVIKSFDPPPASRFQDATSTGLPRRSPKPVTSIDVASKAEMDAILQADPAAINLGKKALKIDWMNVDTEGNLDDVLKAIVKENEGAIDEARRGVMSRDMTNRLANMIGTTEDDLLRANPGLALNAEQTKSWIDIVGSALGETSKLAKQLRDGLPVEAQFRLMLGRSTALLQKLYGVRAEWGRAGGIWGTMAEKVGANAKTLSQQIELVSIGNKTLDQIPAEKLAQMVLELNNPTRQATFLQHATQMGKSALLEAWINGLLSNPVTHATNAVSNALTAATGIIERRIAEQFGIGVARGEAAAMVNGLLGGWDDALTLAKRSWVENRPQFGASKLDFEPGAFQELAASARELSGPLGRAVDIIGAGITAPGRALMAADDFFKGINYRMELDAQAWRQASKEGISGNALRDRYKSLVSDPNFASLVKDQAEGFANYQTFNQGLGEFGQGYLRFVNDHPWMRLVTPFVRTPVNIAKYGLERAPGLNLLMKSYAADMAAGGVKRDLAMAKMTVGGLTMATGVTLGLAGYITGGGPKDKNLLAAKKLTGWQPYSLHVPGAGYVSFNRFDPLGVLLGLWGNMAEKAGELDEFNLGTLATAAVVGFSDTLMQKTYLSGVKSVFDSLTDVETRGERYLQRLAGTLVPAGVAQLTRLLDPTIKEINSIQDAIYARLPGNDLPARRNLWGQKIELEGGLGPDMISPFASSSEKDDPAAKEMLRLDMGVSMPDKFVFGTRPRGSAFRKPDFREGVEMTAEEYDRFVELQGNELKINGKGQHDALIEMVGSSTYQSLSEPEKELAIRATIRAYRDAAENKTIEEFPDLRQAIVSKQEERRQAVIGVGQ